MLGIIQAELSQVSSEASHLDPQRLIDIADVMSYSLSNEGTVYFAGCSDDIIKEFAEGYFYKRGPLNCRRYEGSAEKGDVLVMVGEKAESDTAFTISLCCDAFLSLDVCEDDREGVLHIICKIIERNIFGVKAVFIDRDDTINDDEGHCTRPEQIHIFPFVPEALKRLNDAGYLVIMITNQSVIGRGMIDEKGLELIHDKVRQDLLPGRLDDIFYCPHVPDGGCDCRKPKLGMGLKALKKYCIDTRRSYMIGDSDRDVEFGEGMGCEPIKVDKKFTFEDAVEYIIAENNNNII